jgi:hypothetical protein
LKQISPVEHSARHHGSLLDSDPPHNLNHGRKDRLWHVSADW